MIDLSLLSDSDDDDCVVVEAEEQMTPLQHQDAAQSMLFPIDFRDKVEFYNPFAVRMVASCMVECYRPRSKRIRPDRGLATTKFIPANSRIIRFGIESFQLFDTMEERSEAIASDTTSRYSSVADVEVLVYDNMCDTWKRSTCYVLVYFDTNCLACMANSSHYVFKDAMAHTAQNCVIDYELEPDRLSCNDNVRLGDDWQQGHFSIRPVMFFIRSTKDIEKGSPILLDYHFY